MQLHGESRSGRLVVLIGSLALVPALPARSEGAELSAALIAEGQRLVQTHDCNVCHTPKVMTPQGPQPDAGRLLSGHPAEGSLPPMPEGVIGPGGWGGLFSASMTAWAGPWGVSFGSNLTPDPETGIGDWTFEVFSESLRTGTFVGDTRPYLPPMPTYNQMTDDELQAIFAYLRSIDPVRNEVPAPLPPPVSP
jgi:mono/diheme cytochrome c family protein